MEMARVTELRNGEVIRKYGIVAKGVKSIYGYARRRLASGFIQEIWIETEEEGYGFAKTGARKNEV